MVAGEIPRAVDVLVLGGGIGGYTAAARAAELGQSVVLVERAELGGTCLNVGCIPSKSLISLAHDIDSVKRRAKSGIVGEVSVDMASARRWMDDVVATLVSGVRATLQKVEVVVGTGRLLRDRRVAVETETGVSHFQYRSLIIATGSRPRTLQMMPVDGDRVLDSTGLLALDRLPESLAVVGGGYIGMELGMALAVLGTRVTVLEARDQMLLGFDPELVAVVLARAAELGIDLRTNVEVGHVTDRVLSIVHAGETLAVPAETILVSIGRTPNTDDLQLGDIGLTARPDGLIEIDHSCRTAVDGVFAIGDVTPGPALAHRAAAQGRVAAEVIAGLPSAFDSAVPLIAFTDPEIASVGLTKAEAEGLGLTVTVGRATFARVGRALTLRRPEGLIKLVVEVPTGVILGVHIVGVSAADLIGEAAILVETAARIEDVVGTVHPHPTLNEIIADAAAVVAQRIERQTAHTAAPAPRPVRAV